MYATPVCTCAKYWRANASRVVIVFTGRIAQDRLPYATCSTVVETLLTELYEPGDGVLAVESQLDEQTKWV